MLHQGYAGRRVRLGIFQDPIRREATRSRVAVSKAVDALPAPYELVQISVSPVAERAKLLEC